VAILKLGDPILLGKLRNFILISWRRSEVFYYIYKAFNFGGELMMTK
jgi:hypothetical protein